MIRPGHDAVLADACDDRVQLRMQQRLAAADGNDRCAHRAQPVDSLEHFLRRHRLRKIVEFVAVRAGQIAAADGNDMHQQRMARGDKSLRDHAELAQFAMRREQFSANFLACGHGFWR